MFDEILGSCFDIIFAGVCGTMSPGKHVMQYNITSNILKKKYICIKKEL